MSLTPFEVVEIKESIPVFCVPAESFPDGIIPAHTKLHTLVPLHEKRQYFGISWGGESITYKAAATEVTENELRDKGLEEFTIRAGNYLSTTVDSTEDIQEAFQKLLGDPRVDPEGYCIEKYLTENKIQCMVTLSS